MSKVNDNVEIENHILTAILNIRYGAVEILIHDSKVVQVEKTEKMRFEPPRS